MIADVAAILHTPLPDLLDMDWADFLLWHEEAARIAKTRGPYG